MLPTYSFSEIKNIIRSFEAEEVEILNQIVLEELKCYADYEIRAIFRMIFLRKKGLVRNDVKLEYLLAYN